MLKRRKGFRQVNQNLVLPLNLFISRNVQVEIPFQSTLAEAA